MCSQDGRAGGTEAAVQYTASDVVSNVLSVLSFLDVSAIGVLRITSSAIWSSYLDFYLTRGHSLESSQTYTEGVDS